MHPETLNQLAIEYTREVRAAAERSRPHVGPRGPRNSVRHRAGWTLVEIGLRLAGASDD